MASSRKSKRSKRDLADCVAARLRTVIEPRDRLLVGLSGGVDSVVLLDLLSRLRKRLRFEVRALHVNHQLSPNSPAWARFCRSYARGLGITCRVVKVDVTHGNSTERSARDARYGALERGRADYIVLAHNADDQAETVLMQLFRGAGVKGLAAMPFLRERSAAHSRILRPLLDVSRTEIEDYARRRRLEWVEDESNADTSYLRNWLRRDLASRIALRVPAYRLTLSRAARNCGEAAHLLDELARADAAQTTCGNEIEAARLRTLSVARAKNLLRYLINARGWPMPDADRLEEAVRQALTSRRDARIRIDLGMGELRRKGGMLCLVQAGLDLNVREAVPWRGERRLALDAWGGILAMTPRRGAGISASRLQSAPVTIRMRQGGERLQVSPDRPRRTVKNLLQEARIPTWERERVPFIYCGDTLVCVPGVGIEQRFQATRGESSILPRWSRFQVAPR